MDGVIRDAWWAYLAGRNTEARSQAREVLDGARRRGDVADTAAAEQLLGMVARDELDLAPARAHLNRAVEAWRALRGDAHLTTMHARAQSAYLRLEEGDRWSAGTGSSARRGWASTGSGSAWRGWRRGASTGRWRRPSSPRPST